MGDLDRRDFLKTALASGAGLGAVAGATGRTARADDDEEAPAERVPRRQLGSTGEEIPILLMGCAQRFDPRFDRRLHRAFQEGVDYLDTALTYAGGESHRTLAPFIEQVGRDELWITSKVPHRRRRATPDTFDEGLDTCLEQLEVEHIDLFYMHALNDLKYLRDEFIDMGRRLKESGRTRFFGFSCHDGNVVDLLNRAAEVGSDGIDAIMFRFNFAQYGDLALNRAIDACKDAGIGLIAMKTQNSVPADQEEVAEFRSRDFTLGQAKLKAVWEDERIDAAVSHMDSVEKVEENCAAAKSPVRLGMHEFQQLRRLAACTQGCNHLCESRIAGETKVADALRFLMYYESYGERDEARQLYRELTPAERRLEGVDFGAAEAACPAGIDIPARLERARRLLA